MALTSRWFADYDGVGIVEGPGYETDHFSEQAILDACDRLLALTR